MEKRVFIFLIILVSLILLIISLVTYPKIKEINDACAWTWFNYKTAIYKDNITLLSCINSSGYLIIYKIDEYKREPENFILNKNFQIDDHNNPSIELLRDNRIIAVYSEHGGKNFFRISKEPLDISEWSNEKIIDDEVIAYSNPIYIEKRNVLYNFYREGKKTFYTTFNFSEEEFQDKKEFFVDENQRPYFKYWNDKEKIHFALTNGHPNEITNNIYHFYFEGDNFYHTNGSLIGDTNCLPLNPRNITKVYDGSQTNSWVWDINVKDDTPHIVYTTYEDINNITYRYARWDNKELKWKDYIITSSNSEGLYEKEKYYAAGIVIDDKNPEIVYASIKENGIFEIKKFTTYDKGLTWEKQDITKDSKKDNIRPRIVKDYDKRIKLIWFQGDYTTYTNWSTKIKYV